MTERDGESTMNRWPRRSRPSNTPVRAPSPRTGALGWGWASEGVAEPPARANTQLPEHLVQVVLRGARADEELGTDLWVGAPLGREPGDHGFLGGEHVGGVDGAFAYGLAGGQQLGAGPLGERMGPDTAQHVVREAQLLSRVHAPVLAAQPFAIQEMCAGELNDDPAAR